MRRLSALKHALLRERTLGGRPTRASTPASRRRRERGVALIAVMVAISIVLVLSNDFGTTTNIDLMAAANYRDQMRSHFLARSAVNLAELVIRIQQKLEASPLGSSGFRITDFADQVLLAFCGSPEEVQAAIGLSSSEAKGLGADVGTCGITGSISTDDDKINLNCANGNDANAKAVKAMIDALLASPAYDPVFEEADAEGYRRDRATQAAALVDYVDSDTARVRERGTTEDYGYESLRDAYKPKNNYIDSIGELRLIRGVDDRFWTLFGSAFTAYGKCQVNLGSLTNSQLIAALLAYAAKNPNDPVLQDPQKLFALAGLVAKAKGFGMSFAKVADFVDFVRDPVGKLGLTAGAGGLAGSAASAALSAGLPGTQGGQKLGLELDAGKLGAVATTGKRVTYRVEAWGEVDRKQRGADGAPVFPPIRTTITGVWDTGVTPQNARKPSGLKGAWVFSKED